jgi:hypothetical protein
MYIYKIDIPATGQCYIGQTTKHYEIRFKQHVGWVSPAFALFYEIY